MGSFFERRKHWVLHTNERGSILRNETKRQGLEMGLSWLRVFVAAVLAQFLAGVTDPSILINAGAAAVIPIILRWLDVDDKVYGRGIK